MIFWSRKPLRKKLSADVSKKKTLKEHAFEAPAGASMNILVFSDVHRHKERLENLIAKHRASVRHIFSLGDSEFNTPYLQKMGITAVRGNFPFDGGIADEHVQTLCGRTILFVHGHRHGVRSGLVELFKTAHENRADIAFYGHTHIPAFTVRKGTLVINPGAVNRPRHDASPSCMIVSFYAERTVFTWLHAETHGVLDMVEKPYSK